MRCTSRMTRTVALGGTVKSEETFTCYLEPGHAGRHQDSEWNPVFWADPAPSREETNRG